METPSSFLSFSLLGLVSRKDSEPKGNGDSEGLVTTDLSRFVGSERTQSRKAMETSWRP